MFRNGLDAKMRLAFISILYQIGRIYTRDELSV